MFSKQVGQKLALALAVVVALVAAACGDDSDESAANSVAETTVPAPQATAPPTSTPSSPDDTDSTLPGSTAAAASTTPGGGEATDPGGLDELVAGAQAEGGVTIYSSHDLDKLEAFGAAFEDEYGIPVEVVRGVDTDLVPHVETEFATGNHVADVFVTGAQAWPLANYSKGWFVEPTGPNFVDPDAEYDADRWVLEGNRIIVGASLRTFGWNTNLVPEGLDSYGDLLDPELAGGRIGIVDPAGGSAGMDYYLYLTELEGDDFLEQLAAQEPRIYTGGLPSAEALASGEVSASLLVPILTSRIEAGAPVQHGIPDPLWGTPFTGMILDGSPHPQAAQLLMNYMVSRAGQEILAVRDASVLKDIPGTVATMDEVRQQDLSVLTPEYLASSYEEWKKLFQ